MHHQKLLQISTRGKSLQDMTRAVQQVVVDSEIDTGLCNLFVRHTSASLVIQENADPDVLLDLESFFKKLIPEHGQNFRHSSEGSDDMPAHIRSALTQTSEQIPVSRGSLVLGMWQGIYLWEHRSHGRNREVMVHVMGE